MGKLFHRSQLVVFTIFLLFVFHANGETCTANHVSHFYSQCKNNERVAIYYYNTDCVEDANVFTLPYNVPGLSCDVECPAGKFLPFGTNSNQCISCPQGTYSIGNGDVYNHWNPLPSSFSTYCSVDPNAKNEADSKCSSWVPSDSGDYISSGVNPGNNIKTHLKFQGKFTLTEGNKVRYTYKVDAESCKYFFCDGISFFVDDVLQQSVKKSHVLQWTTVEFQVSPGFHSFQWSYTKDYSESQGQDRAFIKSIEFHGVNSAPESCSSCTAGTYSKDLGSSHCLECNYNEYSEEKSRSCTQCPEWHTSLKGSSACTALSMCTESDYFPILEHCIGSTRKQIWGYWSTSKNFPICQPDPSNMPPEVTVECTCPIGQQLDDNGKCQYCPDGYSKGVGTHECTQCPENTYSPKIQVFEEWSTMPMSFTTSCNGDCFEGWIPRGKNIVPAIQGGEFTSLLSYEFLLESDGWVSIEYSNLCSSYSNCTFILIIDPEAEDPIQVRLRYMNTMYKTNLKKGKYTLTLQYIHDSENRVVVSVSKISIFGTLVGGASECLNCPPGYEPTISTCTKCPPGKYSNGRGSCQIPPNNAVVEEEGMSDYLTCGPNTTPNQEKTKCEHDCTFRPDVIGINPIKYNLTMLDDPINMHDAGSEQFFTYFLNVCSRQKENGICTGEEDKALNTFGCQRVYSGKSEAYDIGKIIGFLPLEPEDIGYPSNFSVVDKGLKITLTEGQFGCNSTGTGKKRSTTIFMLCDISAGSGIPERKGKYAEVSERSCTYEFVWKSKYACPICTIGDYKMVKSDCVNGKQFEKYILTKDCLDQDPPMSREFTCQNCQANCSDKGVCDFEKGTCNCEENFAGSDCSDCKLGKFGENCQLTCPSEGGKPCNGHGVCFSGKMGNGTCSCSTGFKGEKCHECNDGFQGQSCEPIPATITEVFPWWSFIIPVVVLVAAVAIGVIMWRQKKQIENRYKSLEQSNPIPEENNATE